MKSTFNTGTPGMPAVAAIPAVEPTLTIELTIDEAAQFRALVENIHYTEFDDLYRACKALEKHAPRYQATDRKGEILPGIYITKA